MSATIKLEKKHFPVLLDELISIISPLYGGTFIDCTFGQGGYSKEILKNKNNRVIAVDRDKYVRLYAKELEKKYNSRFDFQNIKFSEINSIKFKSIFIFFLQFVGDRINVIISIQCNYFVFIVF